MKRYGDYEMDGYWEDNDNQDGTYFWKYEKKDREAPFEIDLYEMYEERRHNALLYIRAHFKKLMKEEAYRNAYAQLVDECVRKFSFEFYEKPLTTVSEEDREIDGKVLDFEISLRGKKEVEKYKADAIDIVHSITEENL